MRGPSEPIRGEDRVVGRLTARGEPGEGRKDVGRLLQTVDLLCFEEIAGEQLREDVLLGVGLCQILADVEGQFGRERFDEMRWQATGIADRIEVEDVERSRGIAKDRLRS